MCVSMVLCSWGEGRIGQRGCYVCVCVFCYEVQKNRDNWLSMWAMEAVVYGQKIGNMGSGSSQWRRAIA